MSSFTMELDQAIKHLKDSDPVIGQVIDKYRVKPNFKPHTDYYQSLCSAIISQQLSTKAADAIEKRFLALFKTSKYPDPDKILSKTAMQLKAAGLSLSKANYIRDLADKVSKNELEFSKFNDLDNQVIIDELVRVKGIGEWTAHMFLIFCMGRLDVLATGDLGIKNGIKKLYNLKKLPDEEKVKQIAIKNKWHPYSSVACWYVWLSLDNKPVI